MTVGCLVASSPSYSQNYPVKPVTIIVTAAPGGVSDIVARALAQRLSQKWRQQVVVENRGGASHIAGAQQVAKAAPDGHTLLVAEAGTYVIKPIIYPKDKIPYDVQTDLIQVTGLVRIHHGLLVTSSLPIKTLGELIARAKAHPGKISYGTAAVGSGPHLNMVRLENAAGIRLVAVHYRGIAPAVTDVMGGHTDSVLVAVSTAIGAVAAGKMRLVAVGSEKRLPYLPDVPTAAETVPGFTAGTWFGLSVTGRTPPDIVAKINADVRDIIAQQDFRIEFLDKQRYEAITSSPEEFSARVKRETATWAKVVREQGLKIAH